MSTWWRYWTLDPSAEIERERLERWDQMAEKLLIARQAREAARVLRAGRPGSFRHAIGRRTR